MALLCALHFLQYGDTPKHLAVTRGQSEIFEMLLLRHKGMNTISKKVGYHNNKPMIAAFVGTFAHSVRDFHSQRNLFNDTT